MALLTQRIVRDQPFGAADGFRPALVVFLLAREPLERVGLEPREPFAFVRQPLVIAALQQLTGVQLDRFFELPPGHRPLELLDVQPQRRIRAPPQRARSDFDQAVRVRQRAAQVVQDLAQVRMRLALSRVGPEQERHALTRLRHVAVEQQVGKQRFGPRGVQRRELPLPGPEIHGPEQPRAQNRRTYLRMLPYLVPAPSRSDHNREGGSARNARPDAGTQQQRPAYVEGPTVSLEGARP